MPADVKIAASAKLEKAWIDTKAWFHHSMGPKVLSTLLTSEQRATFDGMVSKEGIQELVQKAGEERDEQQREAKRGTVVITEESLVASKRRCKRGAPSGAPAVAGGSSSNVAAGVVNAVVT